MDSGCPWIRVEKYENPTQLTNWSVVKQRKITKEYEEKCTDARDQYTHKEEKIEPESYSCVWGGKISSLVGESSQQQNLE